MTDLVLEPEPPAPRRRGPVPVLLAVAAVVAVVVGAIVLLARSGDDEAIEDPVTLIGSAPDAAREAGTARMTMRAELSGEGMSMDMNGEGVVDFVTGAMSFEMSMFGMTIEMRMLDETIYMRLPEGMGIAEGAWIAMPVEAAAAGGGAGTPIPSGTGLLDALRGVGDDVQELGREEVNGQDATGYRVVIDLREALEQAPAEQRDDLETAMEQMGTVGMDEWPTEIWVTDDGLPVRMVMDIDNDLFDMSMTMDWTDFGLDVDVEAPPEDETHRVTDPSELGGMFGGGDFG